MTVSMESDAILRYGANVDLMDDSFIPSASIISGTVRECLTIWLNARSDVLSIEVSGRLYVDKGLDTLSRMVGFSPALQVSTSSADSQSRAEATDPDRGFPSGRNRSPIRSRARGEAPRLTERHV